MSNSEKPSYGLSDQVIGRIAQIVQEGLLLGVDVVDIMRQMRVEPDESCQLVVLTAPYITQVKEMHQKLLAQAEELQKEQRAKEKPALLV